MPKESFDPPIEEVQVVFVRRDVASAALRFVAGCENCRGDEAVMPFEWILDRLAGQSTAICDYILEATLACPFCSEQINEKTLVDIVLE